MLRMSVVTPTFNAGHLLKETVDSVMRQTAMRDGSVSLEYLIMDGGSTDRSLDQLPRTDAVTVISEPDEGMYEALAKGLRLASGDVHCYLNAGDLYHPNAFSIVSDVIEHDDWIVGMEVTYNARGDVVGARVPYRFRPRLLRVSAYGRCGLPFLQQESTFWSARLTRTVDLARLAAFRLAGDSFLWSCFARHAAPTIVAAHLGGFRLHGHHLSNDLGQYWREVSDFSPRPSTLDRTIGYMDGLLWSGPVRLKARANRRLLKWDGDGYKPYTKRPRGSALPA